MTLQLAFLVIIVKIVQWRFYLCILSALMNFVSTSLQVEEIILIIFFKNNYFFCFKINITLGKNIYSKRNIIFNFQYSFNIYLSIVLSN